MISKKEREKAKALGTTIVINPDATSENVIVRKAVAYKYYGLKVNQDVLDLKQKTIQEVAELLELKDNYVIGKDVALSSDQKEHYHIHFKDERTLEALQKYKQKVMPEWGRTTKLYPPKDRVDNIMCWYGYAVKENLIYASPSIDPQLLKLEQHTQAEFKKSQLNWGKQQEQKKQVKKDLETTIYEQLDKLPLNYDFFNVAKWVTRFYYEEVKSLPIRSQIEKLVWKYLIDRKHKDYEDYIIYQFPNKL